MSKIFSWPQHHGDLTEVWRTRPERTMSGVVRGLTESSVPGWRVSWRGNPAGMNSYGDRLHFSKRIAVLNSWETSLSTDGLPYPLQNWFRLLPPFRVSPGTEDSGEGFRTPDMVRSGRWLSPTLNGEDLVAATACLRQADIKSSTIFYKRRIKGISYFPHTEALSGLDKVRPRT